MVYRREREGITAMPWLGRIQGLKFEIKGLAMQTAKLVTVCPSDETFE